MEIDEQVHVRLNNVAHFITQLFMMISKMAREDGREVRSDDLVDYIYRYAPIEYCEVYDHLLMSFAHSDREENMIIEMAVACFRRKKHVSMNPREPYEEPVTKRRRISA